MVSKPQHYKMERGKTLLLECEVRRLGQYVVLWRKGDRILAVGNHLVRKDGKVAVRDDYQLELGNITDEDAGEYVCEVDVGLGGEARSVRHQVTVLAAPVITKWDEGKEVEAGDDVALSCEATGNPLPKISWRKHEDSRVLLPDETGRKLLLRKVGRGDSGLYICKAENSVRNGVEKVTRVTVNYAPVVYLEQVWQPKTSTFEVRLVCTVSAHPIAQVVWFKNDNQRLSTSDEIYIEDGKEDGKSSLKIENLSEAHFGMYKCRASNSLGRGEAGIEVSGKPRPPVFSRDQREIVKSAKEVNITWSTDSLFRVTQYKLFYRKSQTHPSSPQPSASGSAWQEALVTPPTTSSESKSGSPAAFSLTSSCSHILRNLENESVYDVRVLATNRLGNSNFSKVFNFYVKTTPAVTDFASPRFLQTETKKEQVSAAPTSDKDSSFVALLLLLLLLMRN